MKNLGISVLELVIFMALFTSTFSYLEDFLSSLNIVLIATIGWFLITIITILSKTIKNIICIMIYGKPKNE